MSKPHAPLGAEPIITTTFGHVTHRGVVALVPVGQAAIDPDDVVEVEGVRMAYTARARCGARAKRWHPVAETVSTMGGRDFRTEPFVTCDRCRRTAAKDQQQQQ